jgi:hypothetical protein
MSAISYRGRRAVRLANQSLEIIMTCEGGHLAAVRDLASGINPLWSPPWPTIEPSSYDRARHPEYGHDAESKLLSGILGHNLCLDLFGGPSAEEAAAGMTVHGEASVAEHTVLVEGDTLRQSVVLPNAQLRFSRSIHLPNRARVAAIHEEVENLSAWDRPIAWTQHATLGPPFLEKGRTRFQTSATRSKVIDYDFTNGHCYMKLGAEFEWPLVPTPDGGAVDLRVFTDLPVSGAFSTHLMDPAQERAWFTAWNPGCKLAFGYAWKRSDFPWLGIWEENHCRTQAPWNGQTLTRGMEFGVSPFPENRRSMIERGSLFGVPAYRWLPARHILRVDYQVFLMPMEQPPETLPQLD